MCSTDNDRVPCDDWCRMEPDLPGFRIDLLVIVQLQIHNAVLTKTWDGNSVLRIQCNQTVPRSHIENALFLAVAPISQATARELPRTLLTTRAFAFAVHPYQLSSACVQRDHISTRSGR